MIVPVSYEFLAGLKLLLPLFIIYAEVWLEHL